MKNISRLNRGMDSHQIQPLLLTSCEALDKLLILPVSVSASVKWGQGQLRLIGLQSRINRSFAVLTSVPGK